MKKLCAIAMLTQLIKFSSTLTQDLQKYAMGQEKFAYLNLGKNNIKFSQTWYKVLHCE
ncbi:hypothetical protein HC931_23940 [Candidatus Gracilibacteria bacterium]|nr:hypothetical protein [Candidatus Gracilibacteria bacterium]